MSNSELIMSSNKSYRTSHGEFIDPFGLITIEYY